MYIKIIKYIFKNKIILGKFFNKLHFAMNVRFLAKPTSDKNNNEIFIPDGVKDSTKCSNL